MVQYNGLGKNKVLGYCSSVQFIQFFGTPGLACYKGVTLPLNLLQHKVLLMLPFGVLHTGVSIESNFRTERDSAAKLHS